MSDAKTMTNGSNAASLEKVMAVVQRGLVKLAAQFTFWSGAVLLSLGVADVIGVFGKSQIIEMRDPIFGLPFRDLMLGFGISQSCVAGLLLFTDKRKPAGWLAMWVVANFLVYRIGLWCIGWHHSSGFMFEPLGLSLKTTDAIISFISAGLLIGYCILFGLEYWRTKESKFSKMFCPACGGHIKFAIQNHGQRTSCPHCKANVTLRKEKNLKMACFFCQGHIEFPPHALGTKMACPHCKMDITLKAL